MTDTKPGTSGKPDLTIAKIRPAYQQVAEQLRLLILTGKIKPGDKLPVEAEFSTSFGVSRSTMREALRVLSSQGLVRTTRGPQGGTFVAEIDSASISDYLETSLGMLSSAAGFTAANLLESREVLEVRAASLAAERHTDSDLVALQEELHKEEVQGPGLERTGADYGFHTALVRASKNPLLELMAVPIYRVIANQDLRPSGEHLWQQVMVDHGEILEHIRAGDGAAAADAMRKHLGVLRPGYEAGLT